MLLTRQAALALLDGDIEDGDRLSREAAAVGEAVGESDTGNVRMSQRLEIVRVRADPDELRRTAADAVRAGRRRHRAERPGTLRNAAERPEATRRHMRGQRRLVCFMGAHAHRIGLLQAALGDPTRAGGSLRQAIDIHRRLGARIWEEESRRALAGLSTPAPTSGATMRLVGDLWQVNYRGRTAHLRNAKGLRDLAMLLARPGTDVPAVELAAQGGPSVVDRIADELVLDVTALRGYRQRLADLADELAAAEADADLARQQRAGDERERLLIEASHLDRTVRTGHVCRYDGEPVAPPGRHQ